MIIIYLLSGPLFAAIVFVALSVSGSSSLVALTGGLVAGICAPAFIASLLVVFKSKLPVKIIDKLTLKNGSVDACFLSIFQGLLSLFIGFTLAVERLKGLFLNKTSVFLCGSAVDA